MAVMGVEHIANTTVYFALSPSPKNPGWTRVDNGEGGLSLSPHKPIWASGFGADRGQIERWPEFVMNGSNAHKIYSTQFGVLLRACASAGFGPGTLLRLRGL